MAERSGRILVRLPVDLHAALVAEAARQGTSLNTLIVALLAGAPVWRTPSARSGATHRCPHCSFRTRDLAAYQLHVAGDDHPLDCDNCGGELTTTKTGIVVCDYCAPFNVERANEGAQA